MNADTEDHATFKKLAKTYTRQNGYTYGNTKDGIIYKTNGEMNDWMYGERKSRIKYSASPSKLEIPSNHPKVKSQNLSRKT